jgi:TolA-binding protein
MMREKKKGTLLTSLFIAVMLLFSAVMAVFVPLRSGLNFSLEDTARSLETSRGRERKQQAEYDEVTAELPRVREELRETQPRAEAAAEEVKRLKEVRKQLRAEKKALEAAARTGDAEESPAPAGKGVPDAPAQEAPDGHASSKEEMP